MNKICFPMMANYSIPINYFLKKVLKSEVITPPIITNKTIELGNRYSPEFVCTPFKYTLGSFIESLEKGANILIQQGGGCRYGYYGEVQNEILKDLGYSFRMINFIIAGKLNLKRVYNNLLLIEKINIFKTIYYFINTRCIIKYMDEIDDYIRRNEAFENNKNEFRLLKEEFLQNIIKYDNLINIYRCYKKYKKKIEKIEINKNSKCIRIGIVGELYTIMEPFANGEIEKMLIRKKIEVQRYTNVDYLLFKRNKLIKKAIKNSKYIKFKMGAHASDNIYMVEKLCEDKVDGIIHMKSSFCTPEIASQLIIDKICKDKKIPIMFMSFDANTSEVGIKTRIEAFCDMLEMNK